MAKEVIRLFGDVSNGAGFADLLRIGQDDKLHPDVHAALLRGLVRMCNRLFCMRVCIHKRYCSGPFWSALKCGPC